MFPRLKINRTWSVEDLEGAWKDLPEGPQKRKVNAIRCAFLTIDQHMTRREFAAIYHVSARTVQRWIHIFNTWGLEGLLKSRSSAYGQGYRADWDQFHKRVLPEAERALLEEGGTPTIKKLWRMSKDRNQFTGSYSTFRRYLGIKRNVYVKRRLRSDRP
jgi:transposase